MRIRWTNLALALGVMTLSVSAAQAASKPKKKHAHKVVHHRVTHHRSSHRVVHKTAKKGNHLVSSGAETTLVGVTLFDSGVHVIALYGTPDVIQAANVAAVTAGGGGGGAPGGPGGFPGAGGPRGGRGGGGGGGNSGAAYTGPDEFGDEVLRQAGPPGQMPPGYGGPPNGSGPNRGGYGGPPAGYGAPPGAGGPGGPPGRGTGGRGPGMGNSGGGAADDVVYTRWSYVRGDSRYGFVFDKFNRVVQIEAVGIENPKVHTRRGIGFGNNFASIIKTYGPPDGYDIQSDSALTVRYLIRSKVAFRLSRLAAKKPPVVTGIVVAAAKG